MSKRSDSSDGLQRNIRSALVLLIGLLPNSGLKRAALRRLCGWSIHETARIAPCVLRNVQHVEMLANSALGLSVFSNLQHLKVGECSVIGHWNWITSAPELFTPGLSSGQGVKAAEIALGDSASMTSRHYIDCSGGVEIGAFSVVAGVRSTILTHQVNTLRSEQEVRPVTIGSYCLIGSNVKLVPGATVPDRCTVAMGSVVVAGLSEEGVLYAGVPARRVRNISSGRYFSRSNRFVEIP